MTNAYGNRRWAAVMVATTLMMLAAPIAAPAQTITVLASFNGQHANPWTAPLVQGADGDFYGTTIYGGTFNSCSEGCGTVFKMTPAGQVTRLHSFDGTDGSYPFAGLVLATDGNFYGTTYTGGAIPNCDNGPYGCGTVFKMTPSGVLTTLHSFAFTDGNGPEAGLVQGADGNLYGTTYEGGSSNAGTVFKITLGGTLTTLHSFDVTDGWYPSAGLVQGTDGYFYGTVSQGGTYGYGTVFKISSSGTLTTLHNFDNNGIDGAVPTAGLIQASDGSFYGTTYGGGADYSGTVFRINSAGTVTIVHSFVQTDGYEIQAGLVQGTDGNFYGTNLSGGAHDQGTIFKVTPEGRLTTLYSFCSQNQCSAGGTANAGLMQATNGNFYGTTSYGGAHDSGIVYSLAMGLGPFVKTVPITGKVGKPVGIFGTNLIGATSITFNGTAAVFKVISSSLVTTTVPAGATSGPVQAVTPSGTLTSNVNFQVLP